MRSFLALALGAWTFFAAPAICRGSAGLLCCAEAKKTPTPFAKATCAATGDDCCGHRDSEPPASSPRPEHREASCTLVCGNPIQHASPRVMPSEDAPTAMAWLAPERTPATAPLAALGTAVNGRGTADPPDTTRNSPLLI